MRSIGRASFVRGVVALSLAAAGCGAGAHGPSRPVDPDWPAHPPTRTIACEAPLGACPSVASVRVRWPDERVPSGTDVLVDRAAVDPDELAVGLCIAPGTHAFGIDTPLEAGAPRRSAIGTFDVIAGGQTQLALSAGPTPLALALTSSHVAQSLDATLAGLREAEVPTLPPGASPEERRLFGPRLAAAFDAWRARLDRVQAFAIENGSGPLRDAAADHRARAEVIARSLSEERPSADRVAALQRSVREEIAAASEMVAIEHVCPVYAEDESAPLAQVSVEVRPHRSATARVVRMRAAIDAVEVLDLRATGATLEPAVVDGVAPLGEHVLRVEVTFAREGTAGPQVVRESAPVVVTREGTRLHVGARDGSERPITIGSEPAAP